MPPGERPEDETEAEKRHGVDVEQHARPGRGDGRVDDARHRDERQDHGEDADPALDPGAAAEERPPEDHHQAQGESSQSRDHAGGVAGDEPRQAEPEEPLERHGGDAGPKPERPAGTGLAGRGGGHLEPSHESVMDAPESTLPMF